VRAPDVKSAGVPETSLGIDPDLDTGTSVDAGVTTETAMKASQPAATPVQSSSAAAFGATAALLALIALAVAWEWWLAPLRPGGSALVLKAVPLLLALPGVRRRRLYTLQWASMLILLYFAEGVVRGWSDPGLSARLGWLQAALAVIFFVCTLAYVAPFKRAAKRAAKQAKSPVEKRVEVQATSEVETTVTAQAVAQAENPARPQAATDTATQAAKHGLPTPQDDRQPNPNP
jgi:uncharacterized membrane protein